MTRRASHKRFSSAAGRKRYVNTFTLSSSENRKWKAKAVAAVLASLFAVCIVGCGVYSWRFTSTVRDLKAGEVRLSEVPDGEYEGDYRIFHVFARVRVVVSGGRIEEIELVNAEKMQRADAARVQKTLSRVVEEQSLQVDLVSGASASQKAALKAVERALSPSP